MCCQRSPVESVAELEVVVDLLLEPRSFLSLARLLLLLLRHGRALVPIRLQPAVRLTGGGSAVVLLHRHSSDDHLVRRRCSQQPRTNKDLTRYTPTEGQLIRAAMLPAGRFALRAVSLNGDGKGLSTVIYIDI